ncbi:P-loop NTPase fold protein [Pedobacter sp. MC2016-24]|uniref:P-loop NTPase fold protein n=1 Tax=Pedobacter sp. MC2016-24 TaxID=2780090 RepID=UPI0018806AFB|nr:P-loop NTPase fold protein [Pedobacter sp. MC2016-24]MBE9603137.1 hypothetical protein [Pedobacter sp. MC2016-24]
MTPTTVSSEVNIVLEDSSHAKNFTQETSIHRFEYNQITKFINDLIPKILEDKSKKYLHNTITVLGTRGSGKTSFLLTLRQAYKAHEKLKVLQIIDPTLIEDKGHVFVNIIAAIRSEVFKVLELKEQNEETRELRKQWRNSLMALAAGLPSIDGMSNTPQESWQDPEYVLDKGLTNVYSALKLAESFDHFLKISLGIIEKTSFLLIFDDIDVDATKGWAVLETIRKYFTTSRLITILSGDLKLYSLVVRQKKWKNFGSEILKYEGQNPDKLAYFNNMVTELESQYLQKIMQPKFRIHLLSLQEKKLMNKLPKIIVRENTNDKKGNEIQELYSQIFNRFGIRNIGQTEVFNTFILSQPFRTQIQFASILGNALNTSNSNDLSMMSNSEKITDIFLSDLLEQEIDVNLANSTSKFLNSIALRFLLKRNQLKDLYQLQPSTTDSSLNACLLSLNLLISRSLLNVSFHLSFDYLIKIGYTRNLLNHLNERNRGNEPSLNDLCEKSGLYHDGVLRDTVGKMNAYLIGSTQSRSYRTDHTLFNISLLGLNGPAKRKNIDRLDYVFSNAASIKSILGTLPSYSAVFSFKNSSTVGYSIYLVIAAIGELVRVYENHLDLPNNSHLRLQLCSTLMELSQHRQYPAPDFRTGGSVNNPNEDKDLEEEIDLDDLSSGSETDQETNDFITALTTWLEKIPRTAITPHVLGKISTRFYYALQNIFDRRSVGLPLGELFHYQTVALMNAILIEDIRENLSDSSYLNINNTNFSDKLLVSNIQKTFNQKDIHSKIEVLAYSKWMLSCPILRGYLRDDKESGLTEALEKFCDTKCEAFLSIAALLNQVALEGNQHREENTLSRRRLSNDQLANKGNEKYLVNKVKVELGNILPLIQVENRGEMARRNDELKRAVPNLFPHNESYSTKARDLRTRLKKLGLTD